MNKTQIVCSCTWIGAVCLVVAVPAAWGVDVLVEGEEVRGEGTSREQGQLGIIGGDPDRVAFKAVIHCSPTPGLPNAPGHFLFDFTNLPRGPYRLWARMARWTGIGEITPVPAVTVADRRGTELRYTFPTEPGTPGSTWFDGRPGGCFGPDGEWFWLPLVETGLLMGTYELVVTGDPGPSYPGNLKGLWIDAFRFEDLSGAPLAEIRLPEDETLPGVWEGGLALSLGSPVPGGLSLVFPDDDLAGADQLLAERIFAEPLAVGDNDVLAMWLMTAQRGPALRLVLVDVDGGRAQVEVSDLANARSLSPGTWYFLLWELQCARAQGLNLERLEALQVVAAEPETAIPLGTYFLHAPRLTTMVRTRAALATADEDYLSRDPNVKGWFEYDFQLPAAESMKLTFAVRDFPVEPVGSDKKVLLWASGDWGGMPSPSTVRRRIAELYDSGADGVVLTATPRLGPDPVYFADHFMSTQPFSWEDFSDNLADLQAIKWGSLDHSLLRINVMPGRVDWFEEDWQVVTDKARLAARLCREGGLAGIMFDGEQYHIHIEPESAIFDYGSRPLRTDKSVEDYSRQAHLRGRQMAEAMVAEYPDIDVLTTWGGAEGGANQELLGPFLEGMASVAGGNVYDGNERSYGSRKLRDFLPAYERMVQYSDKVAPGFALWPERFHSPEDLRHALHYALRLSEKYVWLYTERKGVNFWPDGTPPEYYEAIKQARQPQSPSWVPPK